MLLLHGEPGIGKTRLVAETVEGLPAGSHQVLWAQCLRLRSDAGSFLPFSGALSRWLHECGVDARDRVFGGAEELNAIVPEMGAGSGWVPGGRLIALLSLVIHRIAELGPAVLVVDDLQWADASSLEALAYLVVGLGPGVRLSVLGTYRDTELGPGHRLHEWVADMRRMPRVETRPLAGLDRATTALLVREVAGRGRPGPDPDLIFDRSRGNPYLTELLVSRADRGPDTLAEELLSSWRGLGVGARTLTQVVAVGGRPIPIPVLAQVLAACGAGSSTILSDVVAAVERGIATLHRDEVWVRHPLLAEVIAETVSPSAALDIHRAYARVLEDGGALDHLPDVVRAELLAQHEEGAGWHTEAFVWSLRAADLAAAVQAAPEQSEHLQRACRLWPQVDPEVRGADGDGVDLLARASVAAILAGHASVSHELADRAVAAVDERVDPLRASRLLGTLPIAMDNDLPMERLRHNGRRAVQLAESRGDSAELATALANLTYWEMWVNTPGVQARAERAVAVAERAGDPQVLAWAHLVHSQLDVDSERAVVEARQAWSYLRGHDTVWGWSRKAKLLANCLEKAGRTTELVELALNVQRGTAAVGYPIAGTDLSAAAVWEIVREGRYVEADEVLRELFSHRNFSAVGARARSVAARLAARRGDFDQAADHLTRMHELAPEADPRGDILHEGDLEVAWATGDPGACADIALADIPLQTPVDIRKADDLLVWAARAAADLSQAGADRAGARRRGRDLIETAERLRGHTPPRFAPGGPHDLIQPAMSAQFEAERSRCLDAPDQAEHWATAHERTMAAGLRWEAAWAAYHLARAQLLKAGGRTAAVAALRESHRLALELDARPLMERLQSVAEQTRLQLEDTRGPTPCDDGILTPPRIDGVTQREAEVLDQVLRGRTYAQIAQALFISEKTVSVHISNLLRKTGTRSRVELAEFARRPQTSPTGGTRGRLGPAEADIVTRYVRGGDADAAGPPP